MLASPAKTTRPDLPGIVPRESLFQLLDRSSERPIVWISAPAGAGKTTLVASWLEARNIHSLWYRLDGGDDDAATFFFYLSEAGRKAAPRHPKALPLFTPEYLLDLPTFIGNFFENLFAGLKKPSFLVFDDYHEVSTDSHLHSILQHGLDLISEGVSVIFISRSTPPPFMTRFIADGRMALIGQQELLLTIDETAELVRRHSDAGLRDSSLQELYERVQGWVAWPWPLKVYTFGRFGLVRDGVPLTFSGKVQQKPLEMLKALIALGGRNVAEKQLSDYLWPNADWEDAHRSFTVTLHRLRRLLGSEKFIELNEGRLSLSSRNCWIDVWAFERLAGEAEDLMKKGLNEEAALKALSKAHMAIALYRGDFFAGDADRPWSLSRRERLMNRMLRLAGMVGRAYEERGELDRSVDCYLRGIDANELAEELYQRLMLCYRQKGCHGEIALAYKRCRLALAMHGIKPSPRTKAIYAETAFED